jgi:hypothetical protein
MLDLSKLPNFFQANQSDAEYWSLYSGRDHSRFWPTTSFEIRHEKAYWKSYDNIVKVYCRLSREPEVFGHEFIVPKKGVYWEAYDNAYKRELEFFARLVKGEAYEPGLMKTHLKTYNLHMDACRFIDEQASG